MGGRGETIVKFWLTSLLKDPINDNFKYHVKINNGEFSYAPDLLEGLNHDIKLYQLNISKIKYSLLFGLVTEEAMAQSFDEMKTKYRDLIISKNMVEDFLHKFDQNYCQKRNF